MNAAVPHVTPHPPGAPPAPPTGPSATPPGAPGGSARHAGFWPRFGAWFIDETILLFGWFFGGGMAVMIISGIVIGVMVAADMGGLPDSASFDAAIDAAVKPVIVPVLLLICAGYFVAKALYFAFLESSEMQASVGKRALALKVTDLEGERLSFGCALGRFAASAVTWCIFPLLAAGHLSAAFTDRKQSLHDILAGTLVLQGAADAAPAGALHDAPAQDGVYYGGFWIRAGAALIDMVILILTQVPVFLIAGAVLNAGFMALITDGSFMLFFTVEGTFVSGAYAVLFNSSNMQATPGKRIFALKVVDAAGERLTVRRALGRYLAMHVSSYSVVGFFMAGWTERKRSLHDMIAGTRVVNRGAGALTPAPPGRHMVDSVCAKTFTIMRLGFKPLFTVMFFGWAAPAGLISALMFMAADIQTAEGVMYAGLFVILVNWIFYAFASGGVIWGVNAGLGGAAPTAGQMFARGAQRFLPVFLVMLIVTVIQVTGMIFLFIPGLAAIAVFAVAVPAAAAEDGGVFAGMGRSLRLTEGLRLKTLGAALTISMTPTAAWYYTSDIFMNFLFGSALDPTAREAGIAELFEQGPDLSLVVVLVILIAAGGCLTAVFMQTAFAALYHELREIKEGGAGAGANAGAGA